jgi:murein peptide amidase A
MTGLLFDPAAYVRDIEVVAQTDGWTLRYLSPCESGTRPWLQRGAPDGSSAPRLYFSAGIHGDEIAGPHAILEMLRQPDFFTGFDVTLFPILNPNGLARNIRTNLDGVDLNRDYRNPKSAEIRSHVEALKTLGRFDAAMFLHEDFEGIGAYMYALNETLPAVLDIEIITAMGRHVPIDLRPVVEDVPTRGGVIQRRDLILKFGPIEEREDWPEAIYLGWHHTRVSFTTETPMPLPLEQRVKAQIAAAAALKQAVKNSENPTELFPRQGREEAEK